MWPLISSIVFISYVQAHRHHPIGHPYSSVSIINNERTKLPPSYYYPSLPGQVGVQAQNNLPPTRYLEYPPVGPTYGYQQQRPVQYTEESYYNPLPYNRLGVQNAYVDYYPPNNLRQSPSQAKVNLFQGSEVDPFDLDGANSDIDSDTDPNSFLDGQSYFEDLELIENFANYLKRRTQLDPSSTSMNDSAHQYNALLAVLIALARVVRNSCADFDQVYDQVYLSTVDTYYKYGLTNADKVVSMIEDYIRKGYSHMPKIRKLKEELCEKDLYCPVAVDNKIKSSPLLYVKELETLKALAHLARSYYPYIEEFNEAAQKGNALLYLQNSKERLKEYVMHIVNSVEHLTDKAVRCT